MKRQILLKILVLITIISISSSQLLMETQLENEYSQLSFEDFGDVTDDDFNQMAETDDIEQEIEQSLIQAEGVLENLHQRIDNNLSDEEMISAFKESVNKLHDYQEVINKNRDMSKETIIAKNLIAESALQEISEDLEENKFFSPLDGQFSDSEENQRRKQFLQAKKTEIQDIIRNEKSWFKNTRTKIKNMDDLGRPSTDFSNKVIERKKIQDENLNNQKESVKKIEYIVTKTLDEEQDPILATKFDSNIDYQNKSILQEAINTILDGNKLTQTTIDDQNENNDDGDDNNNDNDVDDVDEDYQYIDTLNKNKLAQVVDNEARVKQLKEEVDTLLIEGEKFKERYEGESEFLEELVGDGSLANDEDLTNKVLLDPKLKKELEVETEGKKGGLTEELIKQKQDEEENQITFFKQIVFSIFVVLVILFMIFCSQFDLFSYFSQRRRAKDPFYRDDEAQQSLIH